MRRSILLLMCDFLLVSALAMLPDVPEGAPEGGAAGQEAGPGPGAEEPADELLTGLLAGHARLEAELQAAARAAEAQAAELLRLGQEQAGAQGRIAELEASVADARQRAEAAPERDAASGREAELQARLVQQALALEAAERAARALEAALQGRAGELARAEARLAELQAGALAAADRQRLERELQDARRRQAELEAELRARPEGRASGAAGPSPWELLATPAFLELDVSMKEADLFESTADTFGSQLYLPVVATGGGPVLVAELGSLGLTWSELGSDLTEASYIVSRRGDRPRSERLKGPLRALASDPRVCLVPLSATIATQSQALAPIGMDELRRRGGEQLYVFKKDDPGSVIRVHPRIGRSETHVRLENSWAQWLASPEPIGKGDYVLTGDSRFVGVMVSEEQCFVFPTAPERLGSTLEVHLAPAADFRRFLQDVQKVRERLEKLGLD